MMCPTFLLLIFGEKTFWVISKNQKSLRKPYKSRITSLPLQLQQRKQRSYRPWGCYPHRSSPSFLRFRGFSHSFGVKSYSPKALPHKPFWYICIAKFLFAEHIVLSFAECIISCFEAFVHGFGGSLFATFSLTTYIIEENSDIRIDYLFKLWYN